MKKELIPALFWRENTLELLDQRLLPHQETIVYVKNINDCFHAIRDMVVRGAPLIGFTGIWGVVLWSQNNEEKTISDFLQATSYLVEARPTAVNLGYELRRCEKIARNFEQKHSNLVGLDKVLIEFANQQMDHMHKSNMTMAKLAELDLDKKLNKSSYNIMTLCNTGYLACGPMGTALGVVDYLHSQSKIKRVYACETRPYLQGSRLTSYELKNLGVPHDIVVEGAMSYILGKGMVDAIFVGADRIAENGDTANKIGTSTLSLVAKYYNIPFYIVAPTSTFDLNAAEGEQIPIELRDEKEILYVRDTQIAPVGATALNPSFDITEAKNISGIICENGMISPVSKELLNQTVSMSIND